MYNVDLISRNILRIGKQQYDEDGVLMFRLINLAEIELDLTNTADLEAWLDKYDGSFTRTGEINVFDFEGILQTGIPTDVMGIYGGRRVTNTCLQSQDISNVVKWYATAGIVIVGTDKWIADSNGDVVVQTVATLADGIYRFSFDAKCSTSAIYNNIRAYHADSGTGYTTMSLTNELKRYSFLLAGKIGGGGIGVGLQDVNSSAWEQLTFTNIQFEKVSGQTNQNPSNHIPTTAAAVTKFFNTENANTVSSNVVTEAEGDAIESVIGGAFWPSTTNVIGSAQYRDFSHADWNKVNGSITAEDVVLIDGTTVADKNTFTASAANATLILDPYVSASGVHSGGVFIKRKTGSGVIEVTIDGGSTWVAVTSQVSGDSGWHLCQTTLPTVTDPEFGIRLVGSGDAVYLDWCQVDDGYQRVPAHPIAGGETLGIQFLIATDAANTSKLIKDKQGYLITHSILMPDNQSFGGTASQIGAVMIYGTKSGNLNSSDGSNVLSIPGGWDGFTKTAVYWQGSTKQISANGASPSTGSYDGSFNFTTIWVGLTWNGIISKVIFGAGIKTTQAEMETATTETCWIPINTVRVIDSEGEYLEDENGDCIYTDR